MIPALTAHGFWDDDGRPCTPNPYQAWAMDAITAPDVTELFAFGGFGSGKTTLNSNLLFRGMLHALSEWDGKRASKPRFGLAGSDGAQLRTVTMAGFEAVFNAATGWDGPFWISRRHHNPLVLGYSREDHLWELAWCRLILATGHNGCESWEGQKFVGVCADETPLYMVQGIERAIRRHRQTGYRVRFRFFPATPQPGRAMCWIKERYQDLVPMTPRDGLCRIIMPTSANAAHLPPDYVQQLEASVSPSMARAILHGELVTIEGRVYPDYGPENVIDHAYRPDRPVYVGWDPGFHRSAIVAVQRLDDDTEVVIDEIILSDSSIEAQARELLARPWAANVHTIVHDRAAKQVRASGGTSDLAEMRAILRGAGLDVTYAHPRGSDDISIAVGCERVRARLMAADGRRRLLVSREVATRRYRAANDGRPTTGVHRALLEQVLTAGGDEPDRREKLDHLSHAADALRYLVTWLHPVVRISRDAIREFHAKQATGPRPTATISTNREGGAVRDGPRTSTTQRKRISSTWTM